MRTALKISLILNLASLAGLLFFLGRPNLRRGEVVLPQASAVVAETSAPRVAMPTPPVQQAEASSFRWGQLEARDYHDYVKNLRGIGCPEATVRAIVTSDVYAAYSFRAKEIEKQMSDLNNSSWTNQFAAFKEEAALKNELLNIPDAEDAEVADLLGLKPAPVQVAAVAKTDLQSSRQNQPSQQQGKPVSQPLVLQDVDLSALNLTEEQRQAVGNIRQDFLQQVGGANQNPNDPAYLARWQQAQSAADGMLQAILGVNDFSRYQVLAYQAQSASEQQSGPP